MLSEGKTMSIFDRAPLERPETVRIRFRKVGSLQYISHLDLQKTYGRVLTRAGIPVWYTQGFNPHAKLVFAIPLPIGIESECEFLDTRIDREISNEELKNQLNACLTDELAVYEVYRPTTDYSEIAFAEYEITVQTPDFRQGIETDVVRYLQTSPVYVTKKGKAGVRRDDAVPMIRNVSAEREGDTLTIRIVLKVAPGGVNPESLLAVVREQFGWGGTTLADEQHRILRRRLFLADGETEFR